MKTDRKQILIVDDEEKILASLSFILEQSGYSVITSTDGNQVLPILEKNTIAAVILDLVMPSNDGNEILENVLQRYPGLPVIMLSGHGTIPKAVTAIKKGAFDFLEKPAQTEKIIITIENALKKKSLEIDRTNLIRNACERYRIVGKSTKISGLHATITKVAPSDARVLIWGESGTGKELVARTVHLNGPRAGRPFVVVNCVAIPDELIESELFGHEKGSFTGAHQRYIGKFEQAAEGSLFLDEVGDMSPKIQARVLRAIEESEIQRIGGNEPIDVDVRIIAASNRDLRKEVKEKRFREDLYFRLSVLMIHVPPLRERKEDIALLTDHFLKAFCAEIKRPLIELDPSAVRTLISYDWPGNVRELRNLMEKLVVLSSSRIITGEAIESLLSESSIDDTIHYQHSTSLSEARKRTEKDNVLSMLLSNSWDYRKTARELQISRATLYKKIKAFGLGRLNK